MIEGEGTTMKEAAASRRRKAWWSGLDHRKSYILFLVAATGTYGAIVASLLPSLVSTWMLRLGLSERMAGEVATVNVLAATVGLCLSLFLVSRWSLPRMARTGIALAIAGDLLSILASDMVQLCVVRALAGLGAGLLVGAATNWFGRHEYAARGFGMYIMLQFVMAALLLAVIPEIDPLLGNAGVYVALLALGGLSALLYPLLNLNGGGEPLPQGPAETDPAAAAPGSSGVVKIFSVLAFGMFNISAIGLWSYMLRYGEIVGLSNGMASQTLALSSLCGIPGTILVIILGARYGRFWPLTIGLLAYTVPVAIFAAATVSPAIFIAGMVLQSVAWAVVVPYFQAVQAALDGTGRLAVWGMIVASVGAGLGPVLFGMTIDGESYSVTFATAVVAMAATVILGAGPAVIVDLRDRWERRGSAGQPA